MIDEPDIDELAQEEDQLSIEDEDLSATPKSSFVGYKTLGLASLIAALVGTLGGAGISKLLSPPASDLSPLKSCLLYTSPSPRDQRGSRMPSSA